MVRKLCSSMNQRLRCVRAAAPPAVGVFCQNLGLTQHFRLLIVIPPPKPFIPPAVSAASL